MDYTVASTHREKAITYPLTVLFCCFLFLSLNITVGDNSIMQLIK